MNNQNLIIYEFMILFDILNEIKEQLNFNLLNISKQEYSQLKMDNLENYLIISNNEDINSESQIAIGNYPLKLSKLIETININFLKKKFKNQSEVDLGLYKLNLNSRKMFNLNKILGLTEKEIDIIMFLKKSKEPVTINKLQSFISLTELEYEIDFFINSFFLNSLNLSFPFFKSFILFALLSYPIQLYLFDNLNSIGRPT